MQLRNFLAASLAIVLILGGLCLVGLCISSIWNVLIVHVLTGTLKWWHGILAFLWFELFVTAAKVTSETYNKVRDK